MNQQVLNARIEDPPFEVPDVDEEHFARGARVIAALRELHELTKGWDNFNNKYFDAGLYLGTVNVFIFPSFPIIAHGQGWKAHKSVSQLWEFETEEPFPVEKLHVCEDRDHLASEGVLKAVVETPHWDPVTSQAAHSFYEEYYFDLQEHRMAVVPKQDEE